MMKPAKTIPDWYRADWSPASHPLALPAMTWLDCEQAIDGLAPTPAARQAAHGRLRDLRRARPRPGPMETLQAIILIAATLGETRAPSTPAGPTPPVRTGPDLPRWGFADVEVAISYTFSEAPRAIALQRYSQLLDCYGEARSGAEIMRTIFLTVLGLPVRRLRTRTAGVARPQTEAA